MVTGTWGQDPYRAPPPGGAGDRREGWGWGAAPDWWEVSSCF